MRSYRLALLAFACSMTATAASADCVLEKFLEIPVTMRGSRPIVSARINGKDAQFILDSGAFFSTISPAAARDYGLPLQPAPFGMRLNGINGSTSASVATVQNFTLGGVAIPKLQFVVGGTDFGQVGLLGQNFLGLRDVEYDLRHGMVRLFHPKNCKSDQLAYWPGTSPVTVIPLDASQGNHTIATVVLNGVKLRAAFDTGASSSVLTLSAARRAGVTPTSAGVLTSGYSTGLGTRTLRTWDATFDRIQIGGETIPKPKIHISEADLSGADMLIGADFFLSHRIYVANDAGKMLFTYEGGTVFGVGSEGARDDKGKLLDLTDRAAAPTDAEGFARRGAVSASQRQFDAAIADFDRAIALSPKQAVYLRQRAAARLANRQPLLAAGDLDKALAIDPDDVDALQMRAAMRLIARDPDGAGQDIRALDRLLPPAAGQRLNLASMADGAGLTELGLSNANAWLASHREDASRPIALNDRCWARAQLNRELKTALDDCNQALKARPNTPAYLDSRGLVRLRLGDLPGALADYNAALSIRPRNAWTLYMRGMVKRRSGDATGAEADRKAALAIAPAIADRAAKLGLTY